jgi:predicted amidohydrolase YtcJ
MVRPSLTPGRPLRLAALSLTLIGAVVACAVPGSTTLQQPTPVPPSAPSAAAGVSPTSQPVSASGGADIIFHNGVLLTMDGARPEATAIHIQGEKILAVGDEAAILAEAGPQTILVDLGGRTLMPGFVDAHSHMFEDDDPQAAQDVLLQNGITTTADMYVDESRLAALQGVANSDGLRVRLSAYLTYNTACGEPIGDWFKGLAPTRTPGEMLRIGGVKIFADGGSCNVPAVSFEYPGGYGQGDLYFTVDQLTPIIRQFDQAGWQVAIHALGDRAIDVVLHAYINALGGVNPHRDRIEHNAVVRPDQYPLYTQANVVATIFGPFATCAKLGDPTRFKYRVPDDHQTWEWPWKELMQANPSVHFAWHGDMPHVFTTDIFAHLYGFVTRNQIADDGTVCQAPDWLAANALSRQQALELMTMGSAYALDRDGEVGSLTPGKYADLIILSDNPLTVEPRALRDLQVLMTMVGGSVEYCAEESSELCPAASASEPASIQSGGFHDDFEGTLDPAWSWFQNDAPGWSLTEDPGWLRLKFSTGSFVNPPPPSNLLVRPAPDGDFDLRTHVRVAPTRNFELAGLVVLFDDSSVVQFGHGFCSVPTACAGDGYYFDDVQDGSPVGGNFASPGFGATEDELRLVRTGDTYTAYYLVDDTTWIEVGSHTVDRQPVSVGLIAAQAPSTGPYAEFDDFEMTQP